MIARLGRVASHTATHILFAFFMMGSWAFYANADHAMPKPAVAAFVQGTSSACITLFLKTLLETLSRRFGGTAVLIMPPAIACTLSLGILIAMHWLSGTPEMFATIAVPFSVASIYAVTYNFTLWRKQRGQHK